MRSIEQLYKLWHIEMCIFPSDSPLTFQVYKGVVEGSLNKLFSCHLPLLCIHMDMASSLMLEALKLADR